MDVRLRKVHVVIVRLAENRNDCLQVVVAQDDLVLVDARLLRNELEDQLLTLADFKDAFVLAEVEARRRLDLPLRGLLADVPDHDGLLGHVLHRYLTEVEDVWEVKHGSAAYGPDGHDELLSLGEDHEVIRIVRLGLGRELDQERDLHAWSHAAGHVINVGCLVESFAGRPHCALQLARLFAGLNLEELRVWWHDLHRACDLILVPIGSEFAVKRNSNFEAQRINATKRI